MLSTVVQEQYMSNLVLCLASVLQGMSFPVRDDVIQPQFFVVDFTPVGKIPANSGIYWVTIIAQRPGQKPLTWGVEVSPRRTPEEITARALRSLGRSNCRVEAVGNTRILFYGCTKMELKTEAPKRKEIDKDCRPIVKIYASEADARAGK